MESAQQEQRLALTHLVVVCAVIVGTMSLTYVVPEFAAFRPWTVEQGVPIARLFKHWGDLPEFAGAGGSYRAANVSTSDLEERLGSTIASNLKVDARREPGDGARSGQDATGVAQSGESEARPDAGHVEPAYRIDPSEYEGIDTHIVDPSGEGMRPFYEALLETARQQADAVTRVGHYGDSSIATDLITSTVRSRFQERFGDAGHGFVLPARGYLPYRHKGLRHSDNDNWGVREIVRKDDRSGHYGYGGNELVAYGGAWARVGTSRKGPLGTKVSRFDVYYQTRPKGGDIKLRVDRGEPIIVSTASEEVGDAVHSIRVPDGKHTLDVRKGKGGPAHLYGIVLERDGPGVVYDSLGLVGARALRLTHFNPEHIAAQVKERGTHLIVLGFGGNEASDNKSEENYYEDYKKVLATMRVDRKRVGCLVMAPLDQAKRKAGRIRTMHTIPRIVAAQQRAANDYGCAFFNTWEAMGGEGSMESWYRARPRLAMGDFRHATPLGYEVIGNMLYKAMLAGFAEWLRTQPASRQSN